MGHLGKAGGMAKIVKGEWRAQRGWTEHWMNWWGH